jgi:hypothetical protein
MKLILVRLGRLAGALFALYGVLLAIAWLAAPRDAKGQSIDTARAAETLYITEPKYVFFARERLRNPAPRVLLLGASNTMAGFKQRELQPLLPELEVHNLAVGGANIHELAQVAELVREVQSPAARRQTTYVLGLWYGLFASDEARWHTPDRNAGDTDIDIERYRYGFYRRTEQGAVPLLPPRYLAAGETLVLPYLALDRAARDLTVSLRAELSGKAPKLNDEQRNARVISTDEQQKYLAFWRDYMGQAAQLSDASFVQLQQLVQTLVADGSRVVLVDLPIPGWHSRGAALAADYRERLQRALPTLTALPGVTALDMAHDSTASDDDYSDEVHPKPRVSPRWAERLARALRAARGTPADDSLSTSTARNDHG